MSQYDRAGFQDMPEVVHKAASSKGGRARVKKGFAANPELASKAGRIGGTIAGRNRKGTNQGQEDSSGDSEARLGDILGDLDEQVQE